MPHFTSQRLRQLAVEIFQAVGVPLHEAEILSEHLVEANLAGVDSHGVLRIPQYVKDIQEGKIKPEAKWEVIQETATTALINGNSGLGQVLVREAMALAIEKAQMNSVSAVSVCNCNHTGRLATYTKMATDQDLIGIVMVNAGGGGQSVAPFGGIARRLATNPLSIAIPTGKREPLVLDIATSVASEGKIRAISYRGERLPEGWIIDHRGRPATDPRDFYGPPPGALLPLGGGVGYKGFGLALMIDILAGGLSGAGCCRANASAALGDGVLILVLDIQAFTPMEPFFEHVAQLVDYIKSSPTADGFEEVLVPGEPESREKERRLKDGIFLDEETWRQIEDVMKTLSIPSPREVS